MSSPDRDISAVKSTVDENVPRMNDTTNEEKEYYKHNRLWTSDDSDHCWRSFLLSPGILSLLGLPVLLVGVWALVRGTTYFSIVNVTNHLRDHSGSSTRHCGCGHVSRGHFAHSFRQTLRNTGL